MAEKAAKKTFHLRLYEAEAIVDALIEDLLSRGQLGTIWYEQLEETKATVKAKWCRIILQRVNKVARQSMSVRQRQKL